MNVPVQESTEPKVNSSSAATTVGPQIVGSLLDEAFKSLLLPVSQSLARIETQMTVSNSWNVGRSNASATVRTHVPNHQPSISPKSSLDATSADNQAEQVDSLTTLHKRLDQLSKQIADFRHEAIELLETNQSHPEQSKIGEKELAVSRPPAMTPDQLTSNSPHGEPWEEIIFGSELCGDAELSDIRRKFLNDVVSGGVSARALAAQLLLLQATEVDELPERFRHVGEAYYRWHPRISNADDPLERSLAKWLTRLAETAGLRNSIQLVRPGDRFDSTRHSAPTGGIQVTAVHGWIVLRDNLKVYTKASVALR